MILCWVTPLFYWSPLVELRGHFQFHSGCNAADGHVGPVVVVSPEPFHGLMAELHSASAGIGARQHCLVDPRAAVGLVS